MLWHIQHVAHFTLDKAVGVSVAIWIRKAISMGMVTDSAITVVSNRVFVTLLVSVDRLVSIPVRRVVVQTSITRWGVRIANYISSTAPAASGQQQVSVQREFSPVAAGPAVRSMCSVPFMMNRIPCSYLGHIP